ncbi:MAG: tryptophan synthase subunit beta [Alphaproteobacteria bacterium]
MSAKSTPQTAPNSLREQPNENGHFGTFGGRYVAETLMPALLSLEDAWQQVRNDPNFQEELNQLLKNYAGRPSPLYEAQNFTAKLKEKGAPHGIRVWFKRDELNHTGAHKINNVLGQVLLAQRMGKTRIIAETGAGQHGVAAATACARVGLPCVVYMGQKDIQRQSPNAFRMRLLGAELRAVNSGSATLKDAMNEALRDWVANVDDTFYVIGSVAGPHPYPEMVREFQCVIGHETRVQFAGQVGEDSLPDLLIACIGGGSNAIGLFHPFLDEPSVRMVGVEAGGSGIKTNKHAAALTGGVPGVLHGSKSHYLQDEDGQIQEAHSISAGLDYPGAGPEHAWLKKIGRVEYAASDDAEVLQAFQMCCATEGIIPALEPSHALAWLIKNAPSLNPETRVVVNLCGRGDKDIFTVSELLGANLNGK